MKPSTSDSTTAPIFNRLDQMGQVAVYAFHLVGLFAIGAATVWSAASAFAGMVSTGKATVEDLLLLFIYLEIGAMVGIYFKTNHMPVRFLVYVAITALTRHMIGYVNTPQAGHDLGLLIMSGSVLLLSLAILCIRYASSAYPSARTRDKTREVGDD